MIRNDLFRLILGLITVGFSGTALGGPQAALWRGILCNSKGNVLAGAIVKSRATEGRRTLESSVNQRGAFGFTDLAAGSYAVSVLWQQATAAAGEPVVVREGEGLSNGLEISFDKRLIMHGLGAWDPSTGGAGPDPAAAASSQSSGGERLSSKQVSSLPLNKRDFSQLLLLVAGTQSYTNGPSNFTQQFAVNGQRGTTTVFAMDGSDTTDPELGGATFSNFNVDAVQEIDSSSGGSRKRRRIQGIHSGSSAFSRTDQG
jgi:hypothetical protein